jgi:hypothetical protein
MIFADNFQEVMPLVLEKMFEEKPGSSVWRIFRKSKIADFQFKLEGLLLF